MLESGCRVLFNAFRREAWEAFFLPDYSVAIVLAGQLLVASFVHLKYAVPIIANCGEGWIVCRRSLLNRNYGKAVAAFPSSKTKIALT